MNSLVITQIKFWKRQQGCDIVINNRFEYLSNCKTLIFVGKLDNNDLDVLKKRDIKVYCINPFGFKFVRYFRFVLARLHLNKFYSLKRPYRFSKNAQRKVNDICKAENIECVFVEYVWMAHLVDSLPNDIIKVIDTHDIQNKFCSAFKKINNKWPADIKEDEEFEIYKTFDYVIALSIADQKYFETRLNNVYYLPPTYEKKEFFAVKKDRLSIGFIGGAAYFNFEAIDWFIKNVAPHTNDIDINVYGTVCQELKTDLPNIHIHGRVSNLDDIYRNNHLMTNPTFISGGIKTKNVEALSYGKVVLTTSHGARGLEKLVDKGDIVVCNTPSEYIDYINDVKDKLDSFAQVGNKIIADFEDEFSALNNTRFESFIRNKAKMV